MDIVSHVLQTTRQHRLIVVGDNVLVAVSGGGDSVSMLHILAELAPELHCTLHVAHLDHCIRPESAGEARFVRMQADALGLPATIGRADVPARRAREGGSLECVARHARYEFFRETAERIGASVVATGHTADDQIETVMHNLLRGGDVRTLGGIQIARPIEEGSAIRVVRPLLDISRLDVLACLAARSLEFCTDPSNADTSHTRNRIRTELMPLLESRFNPLVGEAILRSAESARGAGRIVDEWLETNGPRVFDGEELSCSALAGFDEAVRPLLVGRVLEMFLPSGAAGYRDVRAVVELAAQPDGSVANIAEGCRAVRAGDRILLERPTDRCVEPLDVELPVPGEVTVLDGTLVIRAVISQRNGDELEHHLSRKTRWDEIIDADAAGDVLRVRWKLDGDRFRPLGGPGSRKLQDFFVDAKVPVCERARTPLVLGEGGILWVVGHRIDDGVRVTDSTRRLLHLTAQWSQGEADGH